MEQHAPVHSGTWEVFGVGPHNIGVVLLLCILIPIIIYKFYNSVSPFKSFAARPRHRFIATDVLYPYGVEEIQGKRNYMEDRHVAYGRLHGDPRACMYAVFDGHGGSKAADFCVDKLPELMAQHAELKLNPVRALQDAFLQTDRQFMDIARRHKLDDGTTACAAVLFGDRCFVANAGDSRAILVQRSGKVVALSVDHKPHRADEKERIEQCGGAIYLVGVWRVQGILAVSRAIGDRMLKRFVTAEPEVRERRIIPGLDRYLVLATDGLWDVMSNEEVGDLVHGMKKAQDAATRLVEIAYNRGSTDNITALVVDVAHPRKVARASSSHLH